MSLKKEGQYQIIKSTFLHNPWNCGPRDIDFLIKYVEELRNELEKGDRKSNDKLGLDH